MLERNYTIDENTFVIGHVGRFSHPKNHDFLSIYLIISQKKETIQF